MQKKRVIVGLSGGVDSAVSALLLKEQGHDVTGVFMKNWEDDDEHCVSEEDAREARLVADTIGIPFYTFNFVKAYWDKVFRHFLEEYAQGHTPNPDILCNKEIKFKCFLEKALALDADYIATGHYAGVRERDGVFELLKGRDPNKDQSYFLYTLGQNALSRSIFPLADISKSEVRDIAQKKGLPNWDRKDSTGICFIGERKFSEFLKTYLGVKPGDICDPDGEIIGRHQGLMFHTIGQRQGLGLGGPGAPWYVVAKDISKNQLIAARGGDHPLLFAEGLTFSETSTTDGRSFAERFRCKAKIRYRQQDQDCIVYREANRQWVAFDQPQRAIAPRQSIVFYRDEVCLGGGVIGRALQKCPTAVASGLESA